LTFIGDAVLVIHNASFDIAFLNAELSYVEKALLMTERVIDTLQIARQKHPMAPNSLDALCKRYGIDNTRRTKHGALLDSELLAECYIELIGGRQAALMLSAAAAVETSLIQIAQHRVIRPRPLIRFVSPEEEAAHASLIADLGPNALWLAVALPH